MPSPCDGDSLASTNCRAATPVAASTRAGMGDRIGNPGLAARLQRVMRGDVLFDPFTRGRYSTDASIYQIEPIGVALPKSGEDIEAAISVAREEGFPVIPRGGGSSQNGQTLGRALVMDTSRHMNRLLHVDPIAGTALVQPGLVLDELNRQLKATGWYYPVDVSTSANATIGGMTGNNSAGTRSIKYGIMVHNVLEVEAVMADGSRLLFGELPADLAGSSTRLAQLARTLRALYADNAEEIARISPNCWSDRRAPSVSLPRSSSSFTASPSTSLGRSATLIASTMRWR